MPGCANSAPLGSEAVTAGDGMATGGALPDPETAPLIPPPSRRRRPRMLRTLEAAAIVPAGSRNVRRDQSGDWALDVPPAPAAFALAVLSRKDSVWMPTRAATSPTISAVVVVAAGESSE